LFFWNQTRAPRFEWRSVYSESIALRPGQAYGLRLNGERVKYSITASQPVSIAIENGNCAAKHQMLRSETDCSIGHAATLSVTDERTPGQVLAAGFIGVLSRSDSASRAIESNRISITLYDWQCAENCSLLGRH
jgi:hypothetical protein